MKVFYICILFLVISIGNLSALELSLNTADTAPYSSPEGNGFYDLLLKEVFDDLGINLKINHLLSKRSVQNADSGIDDGEYARTEGITAEYKNLIIVPEALVNFYFVAYSRDPVINVSNWNSLTGFNVSYINGWAILKNNVPESVPVTLVSNEVSLFKMLLSDRVDLILYSKLRGLSKIERDNLENVFIIEPPLASRGMYLYLHKKHEGIIPEIAAGIRKIKASGRYDEILKRYLVF